MRLAPRPPPRWRAPRAEIQALPDPDAWSARARPRLNPSYLANTSRSASRRAFTSQRCASIWPSLASRVRIRLSFARRSAEGRFMKSLISASEKPKLTCSVYQADHFQIVGTIVAIAVVQTHSAAEQPARFVEADARGRDPRRPRELTDQHRP